MTSWQRFLNSWTGLITFAIGALVIGAIGNADCSGFNCREASYENVPDLGPPKPLRSHREKDRLRWIAQHDPVHEWARRKFCPRCPLYLGQATMRMEAKQWDTVAPHYDVGPCQIICNTGVELGIDNIFGGFGPKKRCPSIGARPHWANKLNRELAIIKRRTRSREDYWREGVKLDGRLDYRIAIPAMYRLYNREGNQVGWDLSQMISAYNGGIGYARRKVINRLPSDYQFRHPYVMAVSLYMKGYGDFKAGRRIRYTYGRGRLTLKFALKKLKFDGRVKKFKKIFNGVWRRR